MILVKIERQNHPLITINWLVFVMDNCVLFLRYEINLWKRRELKKWTARATPDLESS
jgi:hypothetical protein